MYNLIVGYYDDSVTRSRLLEGTEDPERSYVLSSDGAVDLSRLTNLPTLLMPETGHDDRPQVARIGTITSTQWDGDTLRFRFVANPHLQAIPSERIVAASQALGIQRWEFTRTHWTVKPNDLYGVLGGLETAATTPSVFKLPLDTPREPDLVAVMMPFSAEMSPVYKALQDAANQASLRCHRADDIWLNHHIIDDVISLIWRAQVVVADFTGKNANVFYETGIAHTVGRDTIHITQSMADVPFDLQSIRTLAYLNNDQGRQKLTTDVAGRLRTLTSSP